MLVEVKWPENIVMNVKYYSIEMSLDYTRGKEMQCIKCDYEMDKMTVCHQICPNCGAVVDCSDGVFDWNVLDVRNSTTVLGKNVVVVLQNIIQKLNSQEGKNEIYALTHYRLGRTD